MAVVRRLLSFLSPQSGAAFCFGAKEKARRRQRVRLPLLRKLRVPSLFIRPARHHQRRALVAAYRAARALAELVARCIRPPTDNERRQRHRARVPAVSVGAMEPQPVRLTIELHECWNRRCWRSATGHCQSEQVRLLRVQFRECACRSDCLLGAHTLRPTLQGPLGVFRWFLVSRRSAFLRLAPGTAGRG